MKEILCVSGFVLGLMLLAESANAGSKLEFKENTNRHSVFSNLKSNSKNHLKSINLEVSDEN